MTTPTPLTPTRLENYLDAKGLIYTKPDNTGDNPVDNIYLIGFPTFTVRLAIFEQAIGAMGSWAGLLPMDNSPLALAAAQEWNLSQLFPMITMRQVPGHLAGHNEPLNEVNLRRTLVIGPGITDDQLHDWLDGTFQSIINCCNWLEAHFPDPITPGEGTYEDLKNEKTH